MTMNVLVNALAVGVSVAVASYFASRGSKSGVDVEKELYQFDDRLSTLEMIVKDIDDTVEDISLRQGDVLEIAQNNVQMAKAHEILKDYSSNEVAVEEEEPEPQHEFDEDAAVNQTPPDAYTLRYSSSDHWDPEVVLDFRYGVDDKILLDASGYEVTDIFPGLAEFLDANFVGDEETWQAEVITPTSTEALKILIIPSNAFWPEELK